MISSGGDERIQVDVGNDQIGGTLVRPFAHIPGVLFVHGWGGDREQYLSRAREVAKLGCISLTIDLRGHGKTDAQRDEVTREDNLADVLAAYDRLTETPGVQRDAIAIIGSSYGAYLAAIATTQRRVRWLGLRVPALYEDSDWKVPKQHLDKDALRAYRREVHDAKSNRALAACAEFRGDVLLVESQHDDIVPHATIESYRHACRSAHSFTYRLIEDADHGMSSPDAQRTYTSVLVGWVHEMVFGARTRLRTERPR